MLSFINANSVLPSFSLLYPAQEEVATIIKVAAPLKKKESTTYEIEHAILKPLIAQSVQISLAFTEPRSIPGMHKILVREEEIEQASVGLLAVNDSFDSLLDKQTEEKIGVENEFLYRDIDIISSIPVLEEEEMDDDKTLTEIIDASTENQLAPGTFDTDDPGSSMNSLISESSGVYSAYPEDKSFTKPNPNQPNTDREPRQIDQIALVPSGTSWSIMKQMEMLLPVDHSGSEETLPGIEKCPAIDSKPKNRLNSPSLSKRDIVENWAPSLQNNDENDNENMKSTEVLGKYIIPINQQIANEFSDSDSDWENIQLSSSNENDEELTEKHQNRLLEEISSNLLKLSLAPILQNTELMGVMNVPVSSQSPVLGNKMVAHPVNTREESVDVLSTSENINGPDIRKCSLISSNTLSKGSETSNVTDRNLSLCNEQNSEETPTNLSLVTEDLNIIQKNQQLLCSNIDSDKSSNGVELSKSEPLLLTQAAIGEPQKFDIKNKISVSSKELPDIVSVSDSSDSFEMNSILTATMNGNSPIDLTEVSDLSRVAPPSLLSELNAAENQQSNDLSRENALLGNGLSIPASVNSLYFENLDNLLNKLGTSGQYVFEGPRASTPILPLTSAVATVNKDSDQDKRHILMGSKWSAEYGLHMTEPLTSGSHSGYVLVNPRVSNKDQSDSACEKTPQRTRGWQNPKLLANQTTASDHSVFISKDDELSGYNEKTYSAEIVRSTEGLSFNTTCSSLSDESTNQVDLVCNTQLEAFTKLFRQCVEGMILLSSVVSDYSSDISGDNLQSKMVKNSKQTF